MPRSDEHGVGGEVAPSRPLQGQRERQYADDQDQAFPVDAAIGAVEIDAAEKPHQQAAD
jgi:hypothetical protein